MWKLFVIQLMSQVDFNQYDGVIGINENLTGSLGLVNKVDTPM